MASFTSWIVPTPALRICKRNAFWILMFVSTKIWQLLSIGFFGWQIKRILDTQMIVMATILAVFWNIFSAANFMALVFLADYNNIYRASTFCCGKPFIHKSIIFEYLENPLRFSNDFELDENFPAFLRTFLNDKRQQINHPGKYFSKSFLTRASIIVFIS